MTSSSRNSLPPRRLKTPPREGKLSDEEFDRLKKASKAPPAATNSETTPTPETENQPPVKDQAKKNAAPVTVWILTHLISFLEVRTNLSLLGLVRLLLTVTLVRWVMIRILIWLAKPLGYTLKVG